MTKGLRGIAVVFSLMAVVFATSIIFTFLAGQKVLGVYQSAAPHRAIVAHLDDLLGTLTDAETGQRGFIITGEERYLAPYEGARRHLPELFAKLRARNGAELPASKVDGLEDLVAKKMAEMARAIALRRTAGIDAAAALVRQDTGRQVMEEFRAEITALERSEEEILVDGTRTTTRATYFRTASFIIAGLVNLLFIAWAYRKISSAMHGREAALTAVVAEREEVARQKDLLAVTLASIGDCVIVTDVSGRITFMNGLAEKVTGWTAEEAMLRPASEIFRIINEESRQPVDSPVDKVLEHGVIVGLANHTVLIRKDDGEVPIDDSGAPIREADGTLRGVVLVFRDFTEHKEHERSLREARDAAETANKAKDQFLAMLSHELRTPLTPVLATLNLWEASDELPASMHADAQMLRRSVELEARIIDDLLDLTRIAKGMLSFTPEDTDVHELINFLVGMCRSEFHGKELDVAVRLDAPEHIVHTDAGRLQQVLWNITRNAAKFTETGGSIAIVTSKEGDDLVIRVTDTGIGMTEETLDRLFIPFEQGEQLISRRYGGLGLGMAISSALVGLLGGKLEAASEGLGEGSTFTVTFPLAKGVVSPRKPAEMDRGRTGKGLRLLLVEDHADTARALARLLGRQGYRVETADSVAAGLKAVASNVFDLLLCDIGLPDGTGFQFIEEVRKTKDVPALALSGFGMEEDVAKCREAGFDGHLTKPVNFQKLEAAIWQITNSR